MPNIQLLPDIDENVPGTGDGEFIVIVFDNPVNTFEEVEDILQKATGCNRREAKMETWEVHHLGKSVVHHGPAEECQKAASVIRSIGIKVEVRKETVNTEN